MKERLFITTTIGLLLGTAAFAQSPSEQPRTNSPAAAQSQTNSNPSPAPAASSNSSSQSSTSSQSSPSESSTPSAQNAQSTPSATSKSGTTTTSQSGAGTAGTGNNGSAASQAQSNSPSSQSSQPSQAQSSPPSNASSQAQTSPATNPSASTNNQSQASPSGSNGNSTNSTSGAGAQPSTNTAAQPNNQTNTAQSRSPNVSVSANLNENQRTRVSESIARLNVAPLNNVNFALSVGTVVPRDVRFQALPTDIVEAMPQYRGYDFFVAHDDIVIVEPSSYKIVDVLPRGGRSAAAAPAPRQTTFSERDREVIRKHARSRTEQHTTGSVASTRVRVGDRLPESVEIRSFPDEAYRESPALREYRYIERDNRTYVVEPRERTIIEEVE